MLSSRLSCPRPDSNARRAERAGSGFVASWTGLQQEGGGPTSMRMPVDDAPLPAIASHHTSRTVHVYATKRNNSHVDERDGEAAE